MVRVQVHAETKNQTEAKGMGPRAKGQGPRAEAEGGQGNKGHLGQVETQAEVHALGHVYLPSFCHLRVPRPVPIHLGTGSVASVGLARIPGASPAALIQSLERRPIEAEGNSSTTM